MHPFPPPPPSPSFPTSRFSRAIPAIGVAVAGTLAVAAFSIVTHTFDESGPPHPDRWDPRVERLVSFVEDERGHRFKHPVFVDFLTPEEYTDETTSDADDVDEDERAELDRFAGELRALGVASGKIDLFAAYNAVSDSGTLAFYDPTEQRVRVRGTELTVGLRVTLVHELTHALQDQHFDLERIYDDELDSSASTAFRALIEGDALRIEEAYSSDALNIADRSAYDREYAGQLEASIEATGDVPPFVTASFTVPYLLGEPFVRMLVNKGGNKAVDRALRSPPTTEEHLFDPASFLADEDGEDIDLDLADDVEVLDDGPFGSPSWYLVLAERIDPKVAFAAALGWAGDSYATFEREDTACIRAAFAGDTERDEREMLSALRTWVAALPGGKVEVLEIDGHPGFEACDPGESVDMRLSGRADDALFLPSLWGYLVADAASVASPGTARCYAQRVIDELTYEQIIDPEGKVFEGDDFQQLVTRSFTACT